MKYFLIVFVGLVALVGTTILPLIMNYEKSENEITKTELAQQLETLRGELEKLSATVGSTQNYADQDQQFKQAVKRTSDDQFALQLFDYFWKNSFLWQTYFESLDGFGKTAGVTLTSDQYISLVTTGAGTNNQNIFKQPLYHGYSTFSQKSNIASGFYLSHNTNQTAYIMAGSKTSQGYGFKIVDGNLYGVTRDNAGNETTLLLQALSATTKYIIEARYFPNERVVFYVDDPTTSPTTLIRPVGNITTTLPSPSATFNQNLFYADITESSAAVRTLRLTFFKYWQFRNILK